MRTSLICLQILILSKNIRARVEYSTVRQWV
jgi:hypothetical protein